MAGTHRHPTWPTSCAAPVDPGAATNRILAALLLLLSAGALALSFAVRPSPAGWGTHIRLGFPPCMFHTLVGLPCPFCGMTTAFAHMARGQVVQAFSCHVLGPAFFLGTWILAAWSLWCLVGGVSPVPPWALSGRIQTIGVAILGAGWAVNIACALLHVGGH